VSGRRTVVALAVALALSSCATTPTPVSSTDAWAKFVVALRASRDAEVLFGVKVCLEGGDESTEAWLEQPRIDDVGGKARVAGMVDEGHPRGGSVVMVDVSAVVDWLVACDGIIGGGVTLRAERASLDDAGRAAFVGAFVFCR